MREAFGRGDLAALAEVMADDIEWVDPRRSRRRPERRNVQRQGSGPRLVCWSCFTVDYTTFEPREFIAENDKGYPWYSEATVRDTGRAFVNREAHVGRSEMGSSAASRAITTPERRRQPIGGSSPAREPASAICRSHSGPCRPRRFRTMAEEDAT